MLEFSQFESAQDNGLSYTFALVGFIASFAFILIPVHYFKYRQDGAIKTKYLKEVYYDFKDTTWSKLYMFIFILRRFTMALVIVFMRDANVWVRCIFYTLIQIVTLVYTLKIKPFKEANDNTIEMINEITYTALCIIITICNEESRWFSGLDSILIYSLMFVGLLIGVIIIVDTMVSCIQMYQKRKAKRRTEKYKENTDECINNTRKSLKIHPKDLVLESNQSCRKDQSQDMHKTIKQDEFSSIKNVNPSENMSSFKNNK